MVPGRWSGTTAIRKGPPLKSGSTVGGNNLEVLSVKNNDQRKKNAQVINVPMFCKMFLYVSIRKNIILKAMKSSTATISWADSGVSPSKTT